MSKYQIIINVNMYITSLEQSQNIIDSLDKRIRELGGSVKVIAINMIDQHTEQPAKLEAQDPADFIDWDAANEEAKYSEAERWDAAQYQYAQAQYEQAGGIGAHVEPVMTQAEFDAEVNLAFNDMCDYLDEKAGPHNKIEG